MLSNMLSEQDKEIKQRWEDLEKLQEHYIDFRDFYADVSVELIGAYPSDMQLDIANYVANSPLYSMVMALRGKYPLPLSTVMLIY